MIMDCLRCEKREECWDCIIGARRWFLDCERCILGEECWDDEIGTRQWFVPQVRRVPDFTKVMMSRQGLIDFCTIDKPSWDVFMRRLQK